MKLKKVIFSKNKGGSNYLLNGDGFYISYNPSPCSDMGIRLFLSDTGGSETALKDEKTNTWYILNGDYRKEYCEAFPKGFDACLEVYNKYKQDNRSSWSTDE